MLERLFEKTNFADVFVIVVASLAIVGFWRGVWGLMDLYLFPENPSLSLATSIGIGLVIMIIIAFYRKRKK